MGSETDISRLADELIRRFAMTREMALKVAAFIESRLTRENERFNAWLLSRVLMRLSEADSSKVAAMSMAFAIRVPHVWLRGQALDTRHRSAIAETAKVLHVKPRGFRQAIARSAEFLGLTWNFDKKTRTDAFHRASQNKSWRT